MTTILHTTPRGEIADIERATVALYGYEAAIPVRDTARIAVPGGEVHLDVYPARSDAADGESEPTWLEGRARGTVVFVGGLSAHALQYATFLARLAGRGWNVVALDVRGHGRSSGRRGDFTVESLLDDFRGTVAYARERFGGPVAFMGSSLGGYYALVANSAIEGIDVGVSHWIFQPNRPVTKKDARMKPVALTLNKVAPGVRLNTKGVANWDAVNESAELRARMFKDPLMTWKYTVRALATGMTYAPEHPIHELRIPHLVIIGDKDQMTPMEYTRDAYDELVGDKEWATIPGAGHMGGLNEHQDAMLATVDDYLTRRLEPLGSTSGATSAPTSVS